MFRRIKKHAVKLVLTKNRKKIENCFEFIVSKLMNRFKIICLFIIFFTFVLAYFGL